MPGLALFDGNEGVARHLLNTLSRYSMLNNKNSGGYELHTTSPDPDVLSLMTRYMITE